MKQDYLASLRNGDPLTPRQLIRMIIRLSIPAILAQISSIIMQYIDASMLGHLGSTESASVGLVASSTWLMGGLCMALNIGFTVQIAQAIGAKDDRQARNLVRLGLLTGMIGSLILLLIGVLISGSLPLWLRGSADLQPGASLYFLVFALSIPIFEVNGLATGMIQSSGNMKLPSILHILMCVLDVLFNAFLIFPELSFELFSFHITLPGFGFGIFGAALGTVLAEAVIVFFMLRHLLIQSPALRLRLEERFVFSKAALKTAFKLAAPIGFEQFVMCAAYIASTYILAPLGSISLAANAFSVTAESLCYMPGYGIASAATTIIGQSIGAGRVALTRRLAWLTTWLGMGIMAATGALMFVFAPEMIALISPDPEVQRLGTLILRIEAFAEPMYGASIVANGVFRGAGDTFVPSCMNLVSMWAIRIPLAACLAPIYGIQGVWIAMAAELTCRGIMFLLRLRSSRWQKKIQVTPKADI